MKNDDIAERKKKIQSFKCIYICIKYKRMMEKIL